MSQDSGVNRRRRRRFEAYENLIASWDDEDTSQPTINDNQLSLDLSRSYLQMNRFDFSFFCSVSFRDQRR